MNDLRPYQREGVARILDNRETLMLWPMGAGKTATVLKALEALRLMGGGPALVVGPKRVIATQRVWEQERDEFNIDLRIEMVHGTARQRTYSVQTTADVYTTTFDLLHTEEVQALLSSCDTLVLDELTYMKSFGRRYKSLRKHVPSFNRTIGLTGTPVGQSMMNLFYQVNSLDGGERFGLNKQSWRNKYFYQADYQGYKWEPRDADEIAALIEDIAHKVDGPELPPVVHQRVDVEMNAHQKHVYPQMEKDFIAKLDSGEIVAANAAVASNKLRQMASGFVYDEFTEAEWFSLERLVEVRDLIEEIDAPVILLYQYQAEKDLIMERVPGTLDLDSPDAVNRWNAGDIPVLVMYPRSGGHGLNLQKGGHHLIWWSLPWSLEQWQQTIARLARPGQQHDTVFNHVMRCPGTIEDMMFDNLKRLKNIEEGLLDYFG